MATTESPSSPPSMCAPNNNNYNNNANNNCSLAPILDGDDAEQSCLFVANLPQRMTNEELAMALLALFKPFGVIVSVKASRDPKGRPFGFIEFQCSTAARQALSFGPFLALDNRRIRVEPARRQRKLCIKHRLQPGESLEEILGNMRASLRQFVGDQDFKLSLQNGGEADQEHLSQAGSSRAGSGMASPAPPPLNGSLSSTIPSAWNTCSSPITVVEQVVAAIMKFEDNNLALQACEQWRQQHPEWTMTWINLDRTAYGSNIRNSGLVQLVPGADGTIFIPAAVGAYAGLNSSLGGINGPSSSSTLSSIGTFGTGTCLFGNGGITGGNGINSGSSSGGGNGSGSLGRNHPPSPPTTTFLPNGSPLPCTSTTPFDFLPGPWAGIPFPSPRYTPVYEEQFFHIETNGAAKQLINQLEQLSLSNSPTMMGSHISPTINTIASSSMDWLAEWLGRTLFVGRLNGQLVNLTQLAHHFAPHGSLTFIRLYNRGVVGFDGVPLDAYAFIRYEEQEAVAQAIREEHGRVWLGQAIKCEHARPESLAVIFGATTANIDPIYSTIYGEALCGEKLDTNEVKFEDHHYTQENGKENHDKHAYHHNRIHQSSLQSIINENRQVAMTNNSNNNNNNNWYRAVSEAAMARYRRQKATSL